MELTELNVEELQARQAELNAMPTDEATTDELEARANELEAIKAELEARKEAAKKAEEERQEVAKGNDPVVKEFTEVKKMEENRFAINSPEYREAWLKELQGKEFTEETAVDLLLKEYEVDHDTAAKDVKALVAKWIEIGLVAE